MFELWPIMDKCTVIAKKELLYTWPFGIAAWLCGLIFIPRLKAEEAKNVMNEAGQKVKIEKVFLCKSRLLRFLSLPLSKLLSI